MLKHIIAIALVTALLPQTSLAQVKHVVDVRGYCQVVEKQIVTLANRATGLNDGIANQASDRPDTDPAKSPLPAMTLQDSLTAQLKDKATVWYHLGCTQILYHRPVGN